MARRRALSTVAHGTLGAFVGRNADVLGYWAVGMLCRFALEQRVSAIAIDLLAPAVVPATERFDGLLAKSRDRFYCHLRAASLPADRVGAATIRLAFEPTSRPHTASTRFHCAVTIVDDRGRAFERSTEGWCWPHDPARESRSTRHPGR